VVAVAGPCRYADPPWWAALVPPLWFSGIAAAAGRAGWVPYLTATNVAFRRAGFPGYNESLAFGGDEVDLLRRLRGRGRIVWLADNAVTTSSRRMEQGLLHTVLVSYGYHYALAQLVNRLAGRPVIGPPPAIRHLHTDQVRRRRRQWRLAGLGFAALAGLLRLVGARAGGQR
jgi:hypothetical protein